MIIAVTATAPDLNAEIDPRFGRCPYFLIVNTDDLSFEAVENPNLELTGGAGTQSASLMDKHGVRHVLTGNCGPNAHQGLSAAGIDVTVGCSGPAREAIEQYKTSQLSTASGPSVASHFGISNGPADNAPPAFGQGSGRGMGMGRGRGMGMGGGRGRGLGGILSVSGPQPVDDPAEAEAASQDELDTLKKQADALNQQMQQIQRQIQDLEQKKNRDDES